MAYEGASRATILERAVAMEIRSRRFYEALAAEVPDAGLRERVFQLARDEAQHEAALLEGFPGIIDMQRVLDSLAQPPVPREAGIGMTLATVLVLAMNREREAEEHYKFMAEAEQRSSHENYLLLLKLAEFERQHKVKLQRELESLDPSLEGPREFGRFL